MEKESLLFRMLILLAAMMCALGASAQEAYAVYTSDNTTLSFYYDNDRSSRTGTTYDLNEGATDTGWDTDGTDVNVTKVVFDPSFADARPTTTYGWFYEMKSLQSITGMEYLNTSEVTNMAYMFSDCGNLTSLDLSHFNTSQVTIMHDMFEFSSGLTSLDLSTFSTSKVTDMENMFSECTSLQTIYVGSGWNTTAVELSRWMFLDCNSLVGGQGTTWDMSNPMDKTYAHIDGGPSNPGYFTEKVPEAYAVYTSENTTLSFYYDNDRSSRTGTTYDLNDGPTDPGWVTDFTNLNVKQVVFDASFEAARPTSTFYWFSGMRNLEAFTGLEHLNTSEVIRMDDMFNRCYKLTSLNLEKFNMSKVTDLSEMFRSCGALQTIYVGGGWKLSEMALTGSHNVFKDCTSLVGGKGTAYDAAHVDADYAHIDGGADNPGYLSARTMPYACYTPTDFTLTFYCDDLRYSREGTTYDLNTGDDSPAWSDSNDPIVEQVTNVVFDPSFADARPTSTSAWFRDMENLRSITGLSYLNTSEVTNMGEMFYGCITLASIDMSHFNTSKVTNMQNMFTACYGLTSLDLRSFDTRNVTDMSEMFYFCTNLQSTNLSSFNTSNVTDMHWMFFNCYGLRTIYAGNDWNTAAVANAMLMFHGCTSLVGGQGTTYSESNPRDDTYAHIDGGPSNPGYFTEWKEAYVVYTEENTTLTFYCDDQRDSRSGRIYDLNEGIIPPAWVNDNTYQQVTQAVFDPSFADARPTTTCGWFDGMNSLQSITGMNYLNTSEVTTMIRMFGNCSELTSIDVSNFNTDKVEYMAGMFNSCTKITSLDLYSFNTSNVTNMLEMFNGCSSLQTINVSDGWSTAALSEDYLMFMDCSSLVGGEGTAYDANHVTASYAHIDGGADNPGYLTDPYARKAYVVFTAEDETLTFYYDHLRGTRSGTIYNLNTGRNYPDWYDDQTCMQVKYAVIDPSFADARPTTTYSWFLDMELLESITGLEYLNTSDVTNMEYMFSACNELTSLDLSHFNTEEVTFMGGMFIHCNKIKSLDLRSFNTAKVRGMRNLFALCHALQTIYVGDGWSTASVSDDFQMFMECNSLVGGMGTTFDPAHIRSEYAHIDGGPDNPGYFTGNEAYAVYTAENTTLTFYYDIDRSSRAGTTYDLNTGYNKPGWQTDETYETVTKVVFDPSFADARPTTTFSWFHVMRELESITGLRYLNTSEVTNMEEMFCYCIKLTSLDLSHFNTAKVTKMYGMFDGCSGLTTLDLSGFNPPRMAETSSMFAYCTNLRTIYGRNWDTSIVSNSLNMFYRCNSLVGGQGTTYDPNHIDKTYAHIDGGPSNPGYFTEKPAFIRGDVDGDGNVDISDVTALIDLLLGGGTISNPVADCNQDGSVNISDVTALIDYLLSNHW